MVTKAEQFLKPSNVNVFQCIWLNASICFPKHDQESQLWWRNRNKQSGVKILVVKKKIISTSKTFSPSFRHRNIHKNQVRNWTRCRCAAKFRIISNHHCCCRAVVPVSCRTMSLSLFISHGSLVWQLKHSTEQSNKLDFGCQMSLGVIRIAERECDSVWV